MSEKKDEKPGGSKPPGKEEDEKEPEPGESRKEVKQVKTKTVPIDTEVPPSIVNYQGKKTDATVYGPTATNRENAKVHIAVLRKPSPQSPVPVTPSVPDEAEPGPETVVLLPPARKSKEVKEEVAPSLQETQPGQDPTLVEPSRENKKAKTRLAILKKARLERDQAEAEPPRPISAPPTVSEAEPEPIPTQPETIVLHRRDPAPVTPEIPKNVVRYEGEKANATMYGPHATNKKQVKVNVTVLNKPEDKKPEIPAPPEPERPVSAPSTPTQHWGWTSRYSQEDPPPPETTVLHHHKWRKTTQTQRVPRKTIDTDTPSHPIIHQGVDKEATVYEPVDTTDKSVKIQFTVIKRKETPVIPSTPVPTPVPTPIPTPVPTVVLPPPEPEPPKPIEDDVIRSPSAVIFDYIDVLAGLSAQDIEHEDEGTLKVDGETVDVVQVLKKFDLPDQGKSLDSLLNKDTVHFDFGGLMRQYYSYVLRSYCLINMQDRYRGATSQTKCFTTVDLSKIGTREQEMEKYTKTKLKKLDEKRLQLLNVAVDDDHFFYLKMLADNQATLLPLTIIHTMNEQLVPVLEDVFRFYGKNLGTEHSATKEAGFYYMRIRKRCEMYNNICGGSTLNEDLSTV